MKNIYLYLFIFASLIALIFYINGRKYQEALEGTNASLRTKIDNLETQLKENRNTATTTPVFPFNLENNDNAYDYFSNRNVTIEQVKNLVEEEILEHNSVKGGNDLIDYVGEGSGYLIGDVRFLNHKWVIGSFSDNITYGELLLEYYINEDNTVDLRGLRSALYPN